MVADIKSERWPASRRNGWPASVGIRTAALSRLQAGIQFDFDDAGPLLAHHYGLSVSAVIKTASSSLPSLTEAYCASESDDQQLCSLRALVASLQNYE